VPLLNRTVPYVAAQHQHLVRSLHDGALRCERSRSGANWDSASCRAAMRPAGSRHRAAGPDRNLYGAANGLRMPNLALTLGTLCLKQKLWSRPALSGANLVGRDETLMVLLEAMNAQPLGRQAARRTLLNGLALVRAGNQDPLR
jgi:hypothetical protein